MHETVIDCHGPSFNHRALCYTNHAFTLDKAFMPHLARCTNLFPNI